MKSSKGAARAIRQPDNVVDLSNVREVSRAVYYVRAELETHLNLDTAHSDGKLLLVQNLLAVVGQISSGRGGNDLLTALDELLQTVTDLGEAGTDLLAGANAQIAELAEELEAAQAVQANLSAPISLERIAAEIERREAALTRISEAQVRLEDECRGMEGKLGTLTQLLDHEAADDPEKTRVAKQELEQKLAASTDRLGGMVRSYEENTREIQMLTAYRNAVALIAKGLPSSFFVREPYAKKT